MVLFGRAEDWVLWGYLISAEGDLNAVIADSNARIGELSTEIEELALRRGRPS